MSLTESMARSPEIDPTIPDISKKLAKDFYLSFKFSQGTIDLQKDLFNRMSAYYHTTLNPEVLYQIVNDLPTFFVTTIEKYRLPHRHRTIVHSSVLNKSELMQLEMRRQSEIFISIIKSKRSQTTDLDRTLLASMVNRDLDFCTSVKQRKVDIDPSASYVREYVLKHKPTGSNTFDEIFWSMSRLFDPENSEVLNSYDQHQLDKLADFWELNHSLQSFYPEVL